MNRKIIQSGPATLSVSLPMNWVKKFDLEKGQELIVEEQGNSLRIKTIGFVEQEDAKINITELYPISTKIIGMLYRAGYKKIKAIYTPNKIITHRGRQQKEIDMIKNTFDHLIGMQLWEIGKKDNENYAMTIESAKPEQKEFNTVFNKLYFHLMHQSEQVYEAFSENEDIFDEAYLAERLINQTHDFCIKILVSFGYEDFKKTLPYYDYISKLETIGDRYFEIATIYHEKKEKIDNNIINYLEKAKGFIEESASLYRKSLINKFNIREIISLTNKIHSTIKDYKNKINNKKINSSISHNLYPIFLELYEIIEILFFLNQDNFRER